MAITKTFARAPCPIFAGRGVDNEGFTIKMPYKTYLTCEKANIASERSLLTVFNYDLAEYVYNQTADAYAFGVYVETGGYTDTITDGKHMYAAKFFLKLSEVYSLGSGERHNCDIRAVSIGVEAAYDLSGVLHGAYISAQFKEDADGVTIGGYYLSHTATYGVIGLEVRTEAKDNGDGGITVGAAAFGCVGILVAQKNDAAWTGNYAAIAIHIPYEGSDAIVGTTYGIRFDDAGLWVGTGFDIGISMSAGTIASTGTAISIVADLAIGIDFTGTCSGGYFMVGDSDASLEDSGAVLDQTAWVGIGLFTVITGASGRKAYSSGWSEDHGINVVLQQDGEAYFGFGIQGRYRVLSGGLVQEAMGIMGRVRVASGGTIADGAGQVIGVYGECDIVSGGVINIGGVGIAAGMRAVFDDNGATWTTYGKRCAISCEWEDGTADCALYILKHSGAEAGGHMIEFNDAGTDATDLLRITNVTGCGTNIASFITQSNDAVASLKIMIGSTPYYLAAYSAHHSS